VATPYEAVISWGTASEGRMGCDRFELYGCMEASMAWMSCGKMARLGMLMT